MLNIVSKSTDSLSLDIKVPLGLKDKRKLGISSLKFPGSSVVIFGRRIYSILESLYIYNQSEVDKMLYFGT